MIPRDKYLNQLIKRMNNDKIKIVTGIRRCGKSRRLIFMVVPAPAWGFTISFWMRYRRLCPSKIHVKYAKHKNISSEAIRHYLAYFEEAYLIQEAKRYDVKGRRRTTCAAVLPYLVPISVSSGSLKIPCLRGNAVFLHDSQRIFLLEEGMQLHLVDGGDDFHISAEIYQNKGVGRSSRKVFMSRWPEASAFHGQDFTASDTEGTVGENRNRPDRNKPAGERNQESEH